jgi:NADPH:quinone reductase-like Zn-dependent oxidoreductase
MRAIRHEAFGGYHQAKLVDLPVPEPMLGEVLVAMRTVGYNPLDNTFREGKVPSATYAPATILVYERHDGVHLAYDLMASVLAP